MKNTRGWAACLLLAVCLLTSASLVRAEGGYGRAVLLATLEDPAVTESSGLAASRLNLGVLWTHNDSGHDAVLYATDRAGRALARFSVTDATNVDWEDLAIGPGRDGAPALYVGDIGDNVRSRDDTAVYRVPEPDVDPDVTGHRGQTAPAERFPYLYPDGRHDAETLLVHPATGEVFVVTKHGSGESGVYRFPMPLTADQIVVLEKVRTLRFDGLFSPIRMATAGDISPDGSKLVIRTYTHASEWTIEPGQSMADALAGEPLRFRLPLTRQGEAVAYRHDGQALLLTSEGFPSPLYELPALGSKAVALPSGLGSAPFGVPAPHLRR